MTSRAESYDSLEMRFKVKVVQVKVFVRSNLTSHLETMSCRRRRVSMVISFVLETFRKPPFRLAL